MGKSSSQVIGYWYHPAFHMGLGYGPGDALLEIRGGDKTAWSGELTASGTITVNAPNLWGGEKDQGGMASDMDIMFGEATQQPNAYLTATFGSQQPAWRGFMTAVWKGGRYGAMNPYPQKISYKWRKITKGWDGDACWYPTAAAIALTGSALLAPDAAGWEYQVLPEEANPGYDNLSVPTSGWSENGQAPFGTGPDLPSPANTNWPGHTVLWIRRNISLGGTAAQTLRITAENGCVVFVNGALAAAANRANADIGYNDQNVVLVPLNAGATYEIAVKAFDEIPVYPGDRTFLTIEISADGLTGMNPAHILYYARTQQHMGREPTTNMSDASFKAAADWYYAQGFGLCTTFDASQESIDAFIARIEKVAGCSMTRSPADGLWYLDIANGAYTLADLPILTDDDILAFTMQPATLDSAINSVSVQFFDPQQKATVSTRPVEALALVSAYGRSHQDTSYPEIPTSGLALRAAQRDLQATATPTHGFEITATKVAHAWRKGSYFRLQTPKHGIADMVCIVGDPDSGTLASGAIKFTAVEDIYSLPASSFSEQETGVDTRPPQIPVAIMQQAALEAPYISIVQRLSRADFAALPDEVGYLMTVAQAPGDYRDYSITVSTDGGSTYATRADGPWTPSAQVIEGDALTDAAPATDFTLANGMLLSAVVVGSAALWDNEICRVDAIDATATPPTLTLGRGCADTVPADHAANSVIWFYDAGVGADTAEYTDGETIDVDLLTNSGSQQLDAELATPLALTFDQRQARPYPPAQLKVNDAWYPAVISGDLSIVAVDRDRLSQADQLVDTTQATVGPEAGTMYTLRLYNEGDALVRTETDLAAAVYAWANADELADSGLAVAGAGTLWDPSMLATAPAIWLNDASNIITGTYITWQDISGNARDYTANIANPTIQPTGRSGRRTLLFNGTPLVGNISARTLTENIPALSQFVVANPQPTTGSSLTRLSFFTVGLSSNTSARAGIATGDGVMHAIQRRLDNDTAVFTDAIYTTQAWRLFASEHDWLAQTVAIRLDGGTATSAGTAQGSGNTASTLSSETSLGGASNPSTQNMSGSIAEVLILGYIPTASDRQKIEGYLAWRWGLQANLPAGHPYAIAPPHVAATVFRINGRIRFELESVRNALTSIQHHNVTVRRVGYGFNYGMFYGGSP